MVFNLTLIRRCLFILFFIVAGLTPNKASASHYAAADIYLDYIGTGPNDLTYKVTLVIYKACEWSDTATAIDLSNFESIRFQSSCGSIPSILVSGNAPDTLDQLCPAFAPLNMCREFNSVWPAFVRRVYDTVVTFPAACDWTVYWTSGSRNAGIANLQQPASILNIYVEAGINLSARYNNNSPRFIVDPIPYLCQNQPSFFLNGPLDPDNDSMVTTGEVPLNNSATTPIGYNTGAPLNYPFSATDPIASGTYTVSPTTGTASFTPTLQGKFVLAFKAEDYDRVTHTRLSYIRRDVQVSVLNCNAAPPAIDTIPQNLENGAWIPTPPSGGYVVACAGSELKFNVSATSQTISNSVYLDANNQISVP